MSGHADMFATWLADPRNATHPDRATIQAELDRLQGRPTAGRAQATSAAVTDLAAQILAAAGITPSAPPAEPRTEAEVAAQILAAANQKRVSPA